MTKATTPRKGSFTWGIKSSEITFTRANPGEAVLEGSSTGCDCGCGSAKFTLKKDAKPQKRRAG